MAAAAVNPAMAQQERKQLLALAAPIISGRLASADQIAHSLMRRIRHPHSRQLTGSMQSRQRHRIPPVGLDPLTQPLRDQRWRNHQAGVPKRLDLAQYANVRVKISGACTMSHQPFPYDDIWEPVLRVIDAFGLDRCMWGTDWTRTIGMLTYEQGVAPFRDDTKHLSATDNAALMGGTLQKVYKW